MVGEDEESDYEECAFAFFSPVEMPGEPATLNEALESSDAKEWKKAMESELKSIEENGTWELVELSEGRKAITSKWLFKIKSDADGKIERYKSRLPTTLRTLLVGAAIKGWVVKQMDVTTAFLNGVLEEEIFMAQPKGFDDGSGRVFKLKKALYGLKKAPRQWYLKLRGGLKEIGFTPSSADHSLFMLGEGEQRSFMVVYVDDILIFSPSSDFVKEVMLKLQDKFKCKALGDVSFYLGLHIERDVEKRCMRVHQRKDQRMRALVKRRGAVFHSLVGSLMYAAVNIRPDVAFATGQLARVVQCPNEEQVAAGMRVAKYLGQTPTVGLQYSVAAQRRQKGADGVEPGHLFLTAFSDASYASEPEDMTSVGGFICYVGGGPTAWESKKQVDQALSSVEVKWLPGSSPAFKARYVARGFSQRQGVDYFKIFSPTLKMTTLWVLLHVAAQRDYGLHSLDFSIAFLQGSLHEEILLRRPPGFTGSFLAAMGFTPSTTDPSLFFRTDTSLAPFYVLMYVDDLVFATVDTNPCEVLQRFDF
ncbi:unnamed protein product [Closterium sp. NIES-53]